MRKRYVYLSLLLAGLAAGCDSDRKAASAPPPAPVAADSAASAASPVEPRAEPASATELQSRSTTYGPRPARAVDSLPTAEAASGATTPLAPLYAKCVQAPQVFACRARRDTLLVCAGGTRIAVPDSAFVDAETGALVKGPVELRVREYLSLADMVLNNLSTTSDDGRLLETGGMLNLTATANGHPVKVRPGAELTLALPHRGAAKPGMQLFTADAPAGGAPGDWHAHEGSATWAPRRDPGAEIAHHREEGPGRAMPALYNRVKSGRYKMGQETPGYTSNKLFTNALKQRLKYQPKDGQELAKLPLPAAEKARLQQAYSELKRDINTDYPSRKELAEVTEVAFTVNETGRVSDVRTVAGYREWPKKALTAAISQLTDWQPAVCQSSPVSTAHTVKAYFFLSGVYLRHQDDFKLDSCFYGKAHLQALETALARTPSADQLAQLTDAYLVQTAQLGWINCDRFLKPAQVVAKVRVEVPDADVKLILRNSRSILPGYTGVRGEVSFVAVPAGEPVTILALRYADGAAQIATRNITASDKPERDLAFRTVSLAELKQEIARLGK